MGQLKFEPCRHDIINIDLYQNSCLILEFIILASMVQNLHVSSHRLQRPKQVRVLFTCLTALVRQSTNEFPCHLPWRGYQNLKFYIGCLISSFKMRILFFASFSALSILICRSKGVSCCKTHVMHGVQRKVEPTNMGLYQAALSSHLQEADSMTTLPFICRSIMQKLTFTLD